MKTRKLFLPTVLTLALITGCGRGGNSSSSPSESSEGGPSSSLVGDLSSSSASSMNSSSQSSESKPSSISSSSVASSSSASSSEATKQDGTAQYPYLVSSKADLEKYFINNGDKGTAGVYYSLTNDIEYNAEWKTPFQTWAFSGTILGNNHTIKGLKISRGYTTQSYYSFIGETNGASFFNLNLEMSFDELFLSGKGKTYLIGGVAALAMNTTFTNVNVNYTKFQVDLSTNGDSSVYVGGLTPYWTAQRPEGGNNLYYYDVANCSVKGDIKVDSSESSDTTLITGGVVGAIYSSYYTPAGLFGINNSKYEGSILGGNAVGGICGVFMSYSSIINCYVRSVKLEALNASPSYVGGIVGQGNYFQSLVSNYADVSFINGTPGTNSYKSFAGDIYGYITSDEKEYGYEGTLDYNNYARGAIIDVAERQNDATNKADYSANLAQNTLKFNTGVWDLSGQYPQIKDKVTLNQITISVDANGGKGNFSNIRCTPGEISNEAAQLSVNFKSKLEERENYNATGLYYDQACKYEFRWYTPFNASSTLYVGWADLTAIKGSYSVESKYYDVYRNAGHLVITNQYVFWVLSDGSYSQYEFTYDGQFIYLDDFVNPLNEDDDAKLYRTFGTTYGGYSGAVLTVNANGTLNWYDSQSDDCIYTATKCGDVSIPSLKNSPVLGKWYTDTGKNTLDVQIVENCAVIVNYNDDTAHVHYFGGVRANGSKYTFGVGERGLVSDTYSYDDTNKLLIGARFVLARDKVTAVYSTADFSLRVVVTETKTVVVKDSKVANVAISGTLANNQIVTIDGAQYKVSGKTLAPYEEISPITGTYEGKATRGSNVEAVTMAFNNNGTGTFTLNTTVINFVWTFNQSTNKVNVTFKNGTNVGDWDLDEVFTFTFNADEKKLTGVVTQDYGSYEFTIEVAVGGLSTGGNETGGEEEQEDTGVIGSYSGTMSARSSFAITMEVRGDGTLTIAWGSTRLNYTYTFNESTNKISATMVSQEGTDGCYDEDLYTFTFSDGTIRGTVSYDYGDVEYTFTVSK